LVWGGIWGSAFLLPVLKRCWFAKGLVISFGPTSVQLLLVFPDKGHEGLFRSRNVTPSLIFLQCCLGPDRGSLDQMGWIEV
jgi:hypothetical protein